MSVDFVIGLLLLLQREVVYLVLHILYGHLTGEHKANLLSEKHSEKMFCLKKNLSLAFCLTVLFNV